MNWNKGARTKGRGSSFKGALNYYLHDKDKAKTSNRVGFAETLNLVTKNPHDAWREMMVTAEAAAAMKREARMAPGGQKNTRPVYAFSIQWHPEDKPTKEHMRQTAHDVLKTLNLHEHQAVLIEHTDEPHPHVHICVNLIHPETGATAKLSKDHYILERWADNYELKMRVIRSPERRAKFEALDAGLKLAPKPRTPKRFQEPETKAANDNKAARERAQAIRDQQRDYAARLKATQDEAWKQRAKEQRALWNDYRAARQAIRARHQFQIDQIYKHRRNRHALPLSIQGFRDWKETREWKKLMARLKADRKRFEEREKTLLGFVSNAVGLLRSGTMRTGKGLLPMLFTLLASAQARREIMNAKYALSIRALSDKQFATRKVRAERVKALRDAQMKALSVAFDIQKQALDLRHEQEIDRQRQDWRDLAAERTKLWDEWRQEFDIKPRQIQRTGTGDSRSASPPRPRSKAQEQFLGAGKPVARAKPKAPDSRVIEKFEDSAKPNAPKPGYRQRRSAAERKADGTYKPRQRNGPKPRP